SPLSVVILKLNCFFSEQRALRHGECSHGKAGSCPSARATLFGRRLPRPPRGRSRPPGRVGDTPRRERLGTSGVVDGTRADVDVYVLDDHADGYEAGHVLVDHGVRTAGNLVELGVGQCHWTD